MSQDKKDLVFQTDHFTYIKSMNPIIPDSVIFIHQKKYRYEVVFDESIGWRKKITRQPMKHDTDMLYGRVIGESKIFRILQDNTTTEWVFKNIPYENIIL